MLVSWSLHPKAQSGQIHDTLKARVQADLKAYKDAVDALQEHSGPDFRIVQQNAEHARLAYETARANFQAHIAVHGCY
jgi:hypothetical protein